MVNVYFMDVSTIDEVTYSFFLNNVSYARKEKCMAYRKFDDAKRSVCSEILLKYALQQGHNQNVEMDICYNKYGKPYLNNLPEFHYNVSHAGDWVVIFCGDEEIGGDIEIIQEPEHGMVEQFFSSEDITYINNGSDDEKAKRFTKTWTLKESYVKYIGTGLSTELNSFYIDIINGEVYDFVFGIQQTLSFKSFIWKEQYYVAICSLEKECHIEEIPLALLLENIV